MGFEPTICSVTGSRGLQTPPRAHFILQNRQLIFSPKIPYNLVAERSEATPKRLRNSHWCRRQESSLRPLPCEDTALTTELRRQEITPTPGSKNLWFFGSLRSRGNFTCCGGPNCTGVKRLWASHGTTPLPRVVILFYFLKKIKQQILPKHIWQDEVRKIKFALALKSF